MNITIKKLRVRTVLTAAWILISAMVLFYPNPSLSSLPLQKFDHLAHITIFATLVIFLGRVKGLSYSILISIFLAISTEIIQEAIPSRNFDWIDILGNFMGITIGVIMITLYATFKKTTKEL
jgi:VanZ family protein